MKVYLDNAATTPIAEEVVEAMCSTLKSTYGNPSSIHAHGREARAIIEKSRKTIARLLNTSPSEIFFTSGGTEADNFAICSSINTLNLQHAITTKLEHHAVLHTLEHYAKVGKIKLSYAETDEKGNLNFDHLEELLQTNPRSLVSLMQANNEIGNIYDLHQISEICQKHKAIFHSDTVQTMGHFPHDLQQLKIDFIVGAAHKFHGPKGVGFIYINAENKIQPFIHGGSQERNMRAGTENLYGIVGVAKALELAYEHMEADQKHITALKSYLIEKLQANFQDIIFNGESANLEKSLYTVLNVGFPPSSSNDMLLFNLDIEQISASGGSACTSGSDIGSHVLHAIGSPKDRSSVRFSFGRYNTMAEIDYLIAKLVDIFAEENAMP